MKNCAISSLEQPNGKPLSLTHPSSLEFDEDPDLFITHSISALLTLNTERINTLSHLFETVGNEFETAPNNRFNFSN